MNQNRKQEDANFSPAVNPTPSAEAVKRRSSSVSWQGIPWDITGRIGLFLAALCLIKVVMLIGFRKHLFEVHWRNVSSSENWLNQVAFYVFAILVGLNLWRLGKRCSITGIRTVRMANACILALGASFIFLTFHVGDKNYLYPVLEGTLKWWELNSFLSLNFFFQAPFLAGWLLVYVFIYYGLIRTGREHLILQVTAVFATIYLALFLNGLAAYRNALLVADCLGIAGLLTGSTPGRTLNWFYLAQPLVWLGFFFLIFRGKAENLVDLDPECAILSGWCIVLFFGVTLLAWRRKFHAAWTWTMPFAFASFLLLTNINYPPSVNFRNLFCLGFTLPRYFMGEFLLALMLLCAAKFYRHWLPKGSLLWLDGISLLLIILALADLRLSQIMGVRLDWQAIEFGADMKMVWRMAKPFLPQMAVGLIIMTALYAIFVGLWQRGPVSKSVQPGPGGRFVLLSFLLLGITGSLIAAHDKAESESAFLLFKTSPLFRWTSSPVMDRKTFMDSARQLGLEQMLQRRSGTPTHAQRAMNVVLIFQESSYNKYLSLFDGKEDTQPLLSKYKDRMEVFPNFFSSFAGSMWARFATFTGLYPVSDYKAFTTTRVPVKSIFDVLHEHGYECSMFYSSYFDYTSFRDFLQRRGLDPMYDADSMPGPRTTAPVSWGLKEEETAAAIREQIGRYATNHQKFFLTYVPAAPHNPFDGTPNRFRKFKLGQVGDYTPFYLNELLYMDWNITSILDQLKTSGLLDNTLVIITDDHGEMLGENGGPIGHGWAITPELVNIPLIIMNPANSGYHINNTVGSQVDLLPTVLDLLGIPLPENQLYQGTSLYSSNAQTDRTIYLNSFQQYGVITDRHLVCGNRETQTDASTNDFSLKTYAITNSAARTMFPEIPSLNVSPPSITEFDKFQENFLKNYSKYCQIMRN